MAAQQTCPQCKKRSYMFLSLHTQGCCDGSHQGYVPGLDTYVAPPATDTQRPAAYPPPPVLCDRRRDSWAAAHRRGPATLPFTSSRSGETQHDASPRPFAATLGLGRVGSNVVDPFVEPATRLDSGADHRNHQRRRADGLGCHPPHQRR